MRLFTFILSFFLPEDDVWVDELVTTAANDGLGTLEEYVDVSHDKDEVGEATTLDVIQAAEGFWGASPKCARSSKIFICPRSKSSKSFVIRLCTKKNNVKPMCPSTNNPSECTDVVVWKEYRRGSPEMYDLMYAGYDSPANTEASAETSTESSEPDSADFPAFVRKTATVEVVSHRRVRRGKKMSFIQTLACEIKAKLGTPNRTSANVLTVRHLAHCRCREVNLRAVDTRHAVEQVIELVFANDQADIQAAKIRNSRAVKKQAALVAYQSKSALFRWLVSSETYVSWAWSTSVGHADG